PMAKGFSFDVVSQVDMAEVANAVDQAAREITTRFDFKDTGTSLSQDADLVEFRSSTEHRLKAAVEVFKEKLVRRKVSLKAIHEGPVLPAAKATYKQTLNVSRGISQDKAREINKFVRDLRLKIQVAVQGDQLRVSATKKDDLQTVIGALKEKDFGIPLQFTNYR
ncbi:MAG TPA: YajQ family cyclic di-GMP-binding protein, partial [Actinomycetota bacterium]|nr:YajQ family cyclic di-GMP-binding protein [Actinomycetota bacterium]